MISGKIYCIYGGSEGFTNFTYIQFFLGKKKPVAQAAGADPS